MRYLKYASWIFLALLEPFAATLAVILAPFVVPFYSEKKGHLPFGFRWMETYDNPIDGDEGHVKRWAKIRKIGKLGVYITVITHRLAAGAADKTARDVVCCPLADFSEFCLLSNSQQLCVCRCRFWIYTAVISNEIFAVSVANELLKISIAYKYIALL